MFTTIARERAERGARMLTDRFGPDWDQHIDVERLAIWSGDRCVLAQVWPHMTSRNPIQRIRRARIEATASKRPGYARHSAFTLAKAYLRMDRDDVIDHGFLADGRASDAELTDAWREILTPRVEERVRDREHAAA